MASPSAPRTEHHRLRTLVFVLIGVLLLLGVTAFFLPYLLKRYIEKHSVEWIGRSITIDNIILDPFTFTYAINGVRCTERGSDETFISWKRIAVKSNLWRGFKDKNWRFRELRIEEPYFHIVQHGDRFNFSDLLEMGSSDTVSSARKDTSSVRFAMEDIRITGGRIDYSSDVLKAPVGISALHAECDRIASESARMHFTLGLSIDQGGQLDGGFTIDTEASTYAIDAALSAFALPQLLPYLQDIMHATSLNGKVGLTLRLSDSWANAKALAVSGRLDLDGVGITDAEGAPLVGLQQGLILLDTLNSASGSFKLSRVLVDGFHTRFRMWADGSNTWSKALKLDSTSTGDSTRSTLAAAPANIFVMLADYIRLLGQGFVANQYTADSLLLVNSSVAFEDYTPEKPFRYTLTEVDVRSSRITSSTGTADFHAAALLNGNGHLRSTFRFDPKDFHNVVANLEVKDLSLPDLDAYSRWYGAYPIRSGTLSYTGETRIQGGRLDSRNHLMADDLRFAKKTDIHDTAIIVLPLRLGASLLRDVHGKIDLDIPVQGDLNDPEFKPWPIVWQVLKNLVVKAAAAPVRLVAGVFGGTDGQDMEEVRFGTLGSSVEKDQQRALSGLAETMRKKPELTVALVPLTDRKQEEEEWAAFQAKKRFLGLNDAASGKDSLRAMELSLRDPAFTAFLDEQVPATKGLPERERCLALLGVDGVRRAVDATEEQRRKAVLAYLVSEGVAASRCTFRPGSKEETIGRLGVPGYRFILDVAP